MTREHAAQAVVEARRILAVTECGVWAGTFNEDTARQHSTLTWCDPQDSARAALAESLAAFIADGEEVH